MTMLGKAVDSPVATLAPWLGIITSLQEQFEYSIRVSSLVVGLLIGLIHLWRLLFRSDT